MQVGGSSPSGHARKISKMEDRHSKEISSAIRSLAGAVSGLGFSIICGLVYVGCMLASRH